MVIKPTRIDAKIKGDALADFKGFLFEALASLHNSNRTMVTTKLSAWDKVYRGLPKEATRSFPWENASNIIVQIVGQHTDTLTARILGSLYEVDPLWALIACGAYDASDKIEAKREALEQFLQLNALDPDALDLYRVEQLWFCDAIKYGFKVVKASFESNFEQQIIDGEELRIPVSDGPRIENVNYEDFLCGSSFKTIEDAPFKAERLYLTRQDIEERRYTKKFDSYAVDKLLLTTPDDNGTTRIQREADTEKGVSSLGTTKAFDRWHVYECWCKYFLNGKMYSTVSYVHLASKNFLGGFFNYLPQNKEPYVSARLGYRSSDLYGQGFCELLGNAQEEASAMHNRRNDNATIANLRMFRISPKATNLGTNIKLQPFSILRAGKDEIESLQLGDVYNSTFEEEQLLLQETANRSGTTPAVAGVGAGSPNKKGAYSSQGTFALMTDGNRRVNLDTMDMRYAHMKVGKLILELHSYFGVPSRQLLGFGEQGDLIKDALEKCKEGRLRISVKAATASMNKELDRQNDVFLSQIFNRHFMSMGQLLQSVLAPATPPPIKEYLVRVISASDTLMGKIAKSFNLENVSSFVPKPAVIQQLEDQENKMKQLKKQAQEAQNANSEYSGIAPIESSNGISFGEKQSVQDAYGVPGDDGETGDNGADADTSGE